MRDYHAVVLRCPLELAISAATTCCNCRAIVGVDVALVIGADIRGIVVPVGAVEVDVLGHRTDLFRGQRQIEFGLEIDVGQGPIEAGPSKVHRCQWIGRG